jgi:predicted NAD/FAD-dependent oxidoreductase
LRARIDTCGGEAGFDRGAHYFTVRDPAFLALVQDWQSLGIAAPRDVAGPLLNAR